MRAKRDGGGQGRAAAKHGRAAAGQGRAAAGRRAAANPGRSSGLAQRERLGVLLSADDAAGLETFLLDCSGLPGPRGNLELAHALADRLAAEPARARVRARLEAWRGLSAGQAPTGDPREYLAFCGTLALSADWADSHARAGIEGRIREAAGDARWRMREAAAMALQRIGEREPQALLAMLGGSRLGRETRGGNGWIEGGSHLELRAVIAALAHPPLLEQPAFARRALELAEGVLRRFASAAPAARREEGFRVLRQGLGYALSVLVAAAPEEGFALLERWAAVRDPDVAWVLRENLKKKRLARHTEGVSRLSARLGGK
jgi:hypothetical protein